MTGRSTALALLIVAAIANGLSAQQAKPPVRDAAPPRTETGRISGTVVGAESSRPVRMAKVALVGRGQERSANTDDAGAFEFTQLPAGDYVLHVEKPGYLGTAYGQTRPGTNTPGKAIHLESGQHLERLTILLSHGGSIAGVVRDDHGDPAYGATVAVFRWVTRNGRRVRDLVNSGQTDERGRYRISLLPPRDYIVKVEPLHDESDSEIRQGLASIFYPNASSPREASMIALGLGEERSDVDLQMPTVTLGRVAGVVVDRNGRPVPDINVALSEGTDDVQSVATDDSGRFTFERVVPGSYVATAGDESHGDSSTIVFKKMMMAGSVVVHEEGRSVRIEMPPVGVARRADLPEETPANKRSRGTASADVVVAGGATADLVLTLEPSRTVAGRVTYDGQNRPSTVAEMVVTLTSVSRPGGEFAIRVAPDGVFSISHVPPGKYEVGVEGEVDPWILAAAMSGGIDALDFMLDVPRDRDLRDLTLTLRDRSTELSGTVTDLTNKPVGERAVVVFPSDERLWQAGANRIQASWLQKSGEFAFSRLRPGAYLLAVVDGVEDEDWLDPEFLRKLVPAGVPITLAEGEKKTQDLRVR